MPPNDRRRLPFLPLQTTTVFVLGDADDVDINLEQFFKGSVVGFA